MSETITNPDAKFPVLLDDKLPPGMSVGSPVMDHEGNVIGTIAGRREIFNVDAEHEILTVRMLASEQGGKREKAQFSVPIVVERNWAAKNKARMIAAGEKHVQLGIPPSLPPSLQRKADSSAHYEAGMITSDATKTFPRQPDDLDYPDLLLENEKNEKIGNEYVSDLPEQIVEPKLPTSSPLAQIAFGEQLKLLRRMSSRQAEPYVDRWLRKVTGVRPGSDLAVRELLVVPLRYGETFYWARDVCDMIRQAGERLGDQGWTLTRQAIPTPSGFFYCEGSVGPTAGQPIHALSWTLGYTTLPVGSGSLEFDAHGRGNPETAQGLSLQFYIQHEGRLLPGTWCFWVFGEDHIAAARRMQSTGTELEDLPRTLAIMASMLAFISDELLVASRPFTPDRATRKQAERERPEREPILRVVELRRKRRVGYEPPSEHKNVDWKWQWHVDPFWRKQWYPSLGIHQPKYVGAETNGFWKGPAGAPIKPPTRIFVVDQ